jgi:S1-C subfamily serine protease
MGLGMKLMSPPYQNCKVNLLFLSLFLLVILAGCLTFPSEGVNSSKINETAFNPDLTKTIEPIANSTMQSTGIEGPVTSLEAVRDALIRIQAEGDFRQPEGVQLTNKPGAGSGFFFDPSGIAVTDAHSVVGANKITVWVGSDRNKEFQAEILVVSECKDLAVIQIIGKQNFPYLKWSEEDIVAGTNIFIAGFQERENLFSLVKGVITDPAANQSISWGFLDSSLEYEAVADTGLSGGPLINFQAEVIGLHQASIVNKRRSYGVSRIMLQNFLDEFIGNKRIVDLGINAEAVVSDGDQYSGIWVSALEKSSPASEIDLRSGDLLTNLGGVDLSKDRSMKSYCEELRKMDENSRMTVQVIRKDTQQIMAGEIPGKALQTLGNWVVETPDSRRMVGRTIINPDAKEAGDYFIFTEFPHAENWYSFILPKGENFKTSAENNVLYMDVNEPNSTLYALYQEKLAAADVQVTTLARILAGPNRNNVSLICRATESGWYEFSMNSGGYWFIWKYENGDYIRLATGGSKDINLQKAENELSAICQGNVLSFYINQHLVGNISDDRFTEGGEVGVSVSTFDIPGAKVEFYWFAASVPE